MRKGFVYILVSMISYASFAQVKFGIKAGGSLCDTYKLLTPESSSPRLGWYAGGNISVPVSKRLFVQPELLYSSKGMRISFFEPDNTKSRLKYNYLALPVLVNYKITDNLMVGIGPELAYLLNVKIKYPTNEVEDISEQYPVKFDYGIDVNLGYRILNAYEIGIRYNHGFRTFYYTDGVGLRVGESLGANRAIQVGVSYLFN